MTDGQLEALSDRLIKHLAEGHPYVSLAKGEALDVLVTLKRLRADNAAMRDAFADKCLDSDQLTAARRAGFEDGRRAMTYQDCVEVTRGFLQFVANVSPDGGFILPPDVAAGLQAFLAQGAVTANEFREVVGAGVEEAARLRAELEWAARNPNARRHVVLPPGVSVVFTQADGAEAQITTGPPGDGTLCHRCGQPAAGDTVVSFATPPVELMCRVCHELRGATP